MTFSDLLGAMESIVWGPPTIIFLVCTGIYLTIRMGFVQARLFFHAFKCITGKYDDPNAPGDISHFKALSTALSACVGTGNIAGVATAITMGGPGALFWMWVTALLGMATKFTCCTLAVHYRKINDDGSVSGGPMYYLERGFAPRWLQWLAGDERTRRWGVLLAMMFAVFGLGATFGIGNMVQANSAAGGLQYMLPEHLFKKTFTIPLGNETFTFSRMAFYSGLVMTVLTAMVIIGGIKRIATVSAFFVPIMCIGYVGGSLIILIRHIDQIPSAFSTIFYYAFQPYAAPGAAVGIAVIATMRFGVARGLFSNEAGMGSAPIVHAAAKTNEPAREGMVAMLGPFIDTIIICSMTGLVIIVTGAYKNTGYDGAQLTSLAFDMGLNKYGHFIVGFGVCTFAYSTLITWSYYGDRCAEYLLGPRAIKPYRWLFVSMITVGACGGLKTVWTIADILNALMAIPNLIGLIAMSGLVAGKLKDYNDRRKAGWFN